MDKTLSINDLWQWHLMQSQRKEATEEMKLFHIKAVSLLNGISVAAWTLAKTVQGEKVA
jgi:hypothetical protein